jgi:hypothetical protein
VSPINLYNALAGMTISIDPEQPHGPWEGLCFDPFAGSTRTTSVSHGPSGYEGSTPMVMSEIPLSKSPGEVVGWGAFVVRTLTSSQSKSERLPRPMRLRKVNDGGLCGGEGRPSMAG